MLKKRIILFLFLILFLQAKPKDISIKTNVLYGAYTSTPNIGIGASVNDKSSIEISGGYNPWNLKGKKDNNKKLVHWTASLDYKYWFCEAFNGHFFGVNIIGSQYNISKHELRFLLGKDSQKYRYEGWAIGSGVFYGYQFLINKRFAIETSLGLGYARLNYSKYRCNKCGEKIGNDTRNYWGPTKADISVVYLF